ncbi:MAG: hypothetical protein VB042_03055 [Victivallaceae bacterium]|nr:hypothetical protein [Victivallaceae bacterium]
MVSLALTALLAAVVAGVGCDDPEANKVDGSKSAQEKPNAPGNSFLNQLDQVQYQKAKKEFASTGTAILSVAYDNKLSPRTLQLIHAASEKTFDKIVLFIHNNGGPAEHYVAMYADMGNPDFSRRVKQQYSDVLNFMQLYDAPIKSYTEDFTKEAFAIAEKGR